MRKVMTTIVCIALMLCFAVPAFAAVSGDEVDDLYAGEIMDGQGVKLLLGLGVFAAGENIAERRAAAVRQDRLNTVIRRQIDARERHADRAARKSAVRFRGHGM